jgi:hypothetical protein
VLAFAARGRDNGAVALVQNLTPRMSSGRVFYDRIKKPTDRSPARAYPGAHGAAYNNAEPTGAVFFFAGRCKKV